MGTKKEPVLAEGMFDFVCEHLPEDWDIRIELAWGCAGVYLIDPAGNVVDKFADDVDTIAEMIFERVNWARNSDGLSSVNWDGTPYVVI